MGRIYFNDNWIFEEAYTEELLGEHYHSESAKEVRLPHTCKETPYNYFDESLYQMVCGYRKKWKAPKEWEGKSIRLTLEGAAHSAWIYLNGELIKEHHCGYTACSVELSDKLRYGADNVLVIKVNSKEQQNIPPFGFVIDYMTYGGLYRDVYLEVREKTHIASEFVQTCIAEEDLKNAPNGVVQHAELKTKIRLRTLEQLSDFSSYTIRRTLIRIGEKDDTKSCLLSEKALSQWEEEDTFSLTDIRLWSTETPVLYSLETQLLKNGNCIDSIRTRFGFRKADFRTDGFYLNGKKLKLRGLNRHQSYPYAGYAMPESMQKLDADILKHELGCNAVRTSHYPQSHYFVDRCDELGLLVFMEIPGWQHIGDAAWKNQAVENVKDMITQYRNHTSIILWGVRINESVDDEEFYLRTNATAHAQKDGRCTGGVRLHKKSQLLEDVYTYNDFVHDGKAAGCEPKAKVTSDMKKAYLVSEYNGHMYPTKAFDCEEHRAEHALRHANVLNAVAGESDIAGSFGWCMFDYNTHKDFGSGDRICYHGVMDMYRNPKLAALIYACQQEETPVLELSSSMDIGEHPAGNRGKIYIFTNAERVRMYKNDVFIKEYKAADSAYRNLAHGPILVDDFIGEEIHKNEPYTAHQADIIKSALNYAGVYGYTHLPLKHILSALECLTFYHMKPDDVIRLYTQYIGNWGETATVYRFDAIRDGQVVKRVIKEPMQSLHLEVKPSHTRLMEKNSYDVAEVRIRALDNNDNPLPFYQEPVEFETNGPIALIGPSVVTLKGGMAGVYVKTLGQTGEAKLIIRNGQTGSEIIDFTVEATEGRI